MLQDSIDNYIPMMLDGYNRGLTKEQFYSMNTVDASDVSFSDMTAALDFMRSYVKENKAYAALPPFEEGAFIDRPERRYIHWKILEIQEDSYRMELAHYPLMIIDDDLTLEHKGLDVSKLTHPCWYLSGRVVVTIKLLDYTECCKVVAYTPDVLSPKEYDTRVRTLQHIWGDCGVVGGVVENCEYYFPQDMKKIYKKGKYYDADGNIIDGKLIRHRVDTTMAYASDRALQTMLFVSCNPLIEMFIYINCMLSDRSVGCGTHRNLSSTYSYNPQAIDLRKERHFGKLTLVSEKKPNAITIHNVHRVYSTISWQRRGHLRHLASGKVVPVKSATCTRHGFDEQVTPQVVYKA